MHTLSQFQSSYRALLIGPILNKKEFWYGVKERFIYVNIDLVSPYQEEDVLLVLAVTVGSFERFCVHSADFQNLFHDFCRNNILKSKIHLSNALKASSYLTRKHTTCLLQRPITLCYVESQKRKLWKK
jgi:hypothetical protein